MVGKRAVRFGDYIEFIAARLPTLQIWAGQQWWASGHLPLGIILSLLVLSDPTLQIKTMEQKMISD